MKPRVEIEQRIQQLQKKVDKRKKAEFLGSDLMDEAANQKWIDEFELIIRTLNWVLDPSDSRRKNAS